MTINDEKYLFPDPSNTDEIGIAFFGKKLGKMPLVRSVTPFCIRR
jgi:hypothetical protein